MLTECLMMGVTGGPAQHQHYLPGLELGLPSPASSIWKLLLCCLWRSEEGILDVGVTGA